MRLFLEEALQHRLAEVLSDRGHDTTHVPGVGMQGASDEEVLARARAERRVVVTTDTDFGALLALSGVSSASPSALARQEPYTATFSSSIEVTPSSPISMTLNSTSGAAEMG